MLPVDPVFSSWVNVIKKAPVINLSRNSKSLKGIHFFFETGKLIFLKSNSVFFLFTCVYYSFLIVSWRCFFY